jgi:hypothetical protein
MRSLKLGFAALSVVLASLAFGATAGSASAGGSVLVCATAPSYDADVQAKLVGTGRFTTVDTFDCGAGTPTPSQLASYSAVLVNADGSYADPTALGDELADYADAGGSVVEAVFNFAGGISLGGRWASDGYGVYTFGGGQMQGTPYSLVADVPSSPLLDGVSSFNGGSSSYLDDVTLAPGSTQIAHWNDGASTPLVAYNAHSVGLNFYPPSSDARSDFWDASTDGAALLANALLFHSHSSGSTGTGPRMAVCTTAPVYRSGDGSYGSFADVDFSFWNAKKLDSSSPYFGATPAIYVQGYGLMCQPSDVVTYGGDPAKLTRASYLVTELGVPAPADVDATAAGAYYPYYSAG